MFYSESKNIKETDEYFITIKTVKGEHSRLLKGSVEMFDGKQFVFNTDGGMYIILLENVVEMIPTLKTYGLKRGEIVRNESRYF